MTTFRTVLNRVLRTIAETEVDDAELSLSDDYQILVGTFINQIKEEIEDAHNWGSLRQAHTATITGGTASASVVGANERSRLVRDKDYDNGRFVPLVFDVTDPTNPLQLTEIELAQALYLDATDVNTAAYAGNFALSLNVTGDGVDIHVYPTPTTTRTLQVTMITPQVYLEADDLDAVIKIPARPLIMGSVWYALEERGEEMGINALFTEERFRNALDDAIARDATEQGDYQLVAT